MLEFGNFQCVLCDQEITNAQGIDEIFIHYDKNHKDYELAREQCISKVTDVCQKSLLSSETILKHLLVIHCVKLEDLFEQLPIKILDKTTIQKRAAPNSAAKTTAVIRDNNNKQLYHNGNNLSNIHNITSARENRDFKLEKKVDFDICCYNENHLQPLTFSNTLELERHLKNMHKCFQYSFYTMMGINMSLHISKEHAEQIKCFVCKV